MSSKNNKRKNNKKNVDKEKNSNYLFLSQKKSQKSIIMKIKDLII